MFDIGFWELVMVGLVTLVVVGPARLPKLARTAGLWIGKARYYVSVVKSDIEREIRADELKRILEEQARNTGLHEIAEEARSSLDAARSTIESLDERVDRQLGGDQATRWAGPTTEAAEPTNAGQQAAISALPGRQ